MSASPQQWRAYRPWASNQAIPMDSSVVRTLIKCLAGLFVLTAGDPDIIDAAIRWLWRLG